MKQKETVSVLGDGAFGTAIALLFARNGHTVTLWCYNAEVALSIRQERVNKRYLSDIILPESIHPTTDLKEAVQKGAIVFQAIPVQYLRSVLENTAIFTCEDQTWVSLSKGIEQETLLLPTQIITDVCGNVTTVAVSGPSYAREIAQEKLTGLMVASQSSDARMRVCQLMKNDYCITHETDDVNGIQLAAAAKNVIALALGMLDGAGCGENTKALALTQGLQEMACLVRYLGGKIEIVYSLAGIGDLVLTATGTQSRNHEVGVRLGRGESLESIINQTGYTPEGVNTVATINQLIGRYAMTLPLMHSVYQIISENKSLDVLIQSIKFETFI